MSSLTLVGMNNGIFLQPLENKIDLVGVTGSSINFYDIPHLNLTTRQQIPRLPAPTTMTITPTQSPYFLRNYMNTVTM